MTLRLLVAEDSKTLQRVLEIALYQHDVALMMAQHRQDALAAMGRHAFDAAVIDADLPDSDEGYGLCRELKALSAEALPVLLLTSNEHPFDLARAQRAGVAQSVQKPFTTQALIEAIHMATGRIEASPPSAPQAPRPTDAPDASSHSPHMAAIDEALAALGQEGPHMPSAPPLAAAAHKAPAFIRLEGDEPTPGKHKPKPFFEEETTGARALVGGFAPVTVVRRPSEALREQSRVDAPLPSVDKLPALPSWDAAPVQDAAQTPPPPPPSHSLAQPNSQPAARAQSAQATEATPAAAPAEEGLSGQSPTEELMALLARGPHQANTPRINALLAQTLERQLAQILWQVVPGIVTEEVRRYVERTLKPPGHEGPPPPPPPSHQGPHTAH